MNRISKYFISVLIRILYVVINLTFGMLTIVCIILGPTLYIIFGTSVFDIVNRTSDEIEKWFNKKLEKYRYAKH